MEEFSKVLSSPYWWLSAVVVGILINLVSAYIKGPIDQLLSHISVAWRTRSEKRRADYTLELNKLVVNMELQRQYEHLELRSTLDALFGLMFALLILLYKGMSLVVPSLSIARDLGVSVEMSNTIFYGLSSLIIFLSFKIFTRAAYFKAIVAEARHIESRERECAL